jgi:hypothetical protein
LGKRHCQWARGKDLQSFLLLPLGHNFGLLIVGVLWTPRHCHCRWFNILRRILKHGVGDFRVLWYVSVRYGKVLWIHPTSLLLYIVKFMGLHAIVIIFQLMKGSFIESYLIYILYSSSSIFSARLSHGLFPSILSILSWKNTSSTEYSISTIENSRELVLYQILLVGLYYKWDMRYCFCEYCRFFLLSSHVKSIYFSPSMERVW